MPPPWENERSVWPETKRSSGSVAEIAPDFLESETRDEAVQFVCECGRSERTEPISLTLVEYEAIRADRFRRSRASVERHPAYLVVEKREE